MLLLNLFLPIISVFGFQYCDIARNDHFGHKLRNSFDQHGLIVWLITFAYTTTEPTELGAGGWASQILGDKLTLIQGVGQIMPTTLLLTPLIRNLYTFLRPCRT